MMSKAVKVILALGIVLGLSTIAYASVSTQILLPLVINNDKLYESTPTSAEIPDIIINYIETGGEYMPGKYWEEYVRVKNRTDEKIELTGWTIKSKRTGKIYTFPEFTLGSNKIVEVWTRPGTDTDADLFWGQESEVWQVSGDCARLGDDNDRFVQWYSYPGEDCIW